MAVNLIWGQIGGFLEGGQGRILWVRRCLAGLGRRWFWGFAAVWRGVVFSASLLPHLRRSLAGKAAGQADGGLEALEVLATRDFYGAELLGDGR